ncbi:hypothetical protein L6R53_08865 [Myxococcota bacterium]|nr:hypothetical protein [Myxococcota bacterium]
MYTPTLPRLLLPLLLVPAGCGPTVKNPAVEAIQVGETWVFAYEDTPSLSMFALTHGTVAAPDGCLAVDDAVVVWWPEQLDQVEALVAEVEAGGAPEVQLGGGGSSLAEGGSGEDFPEAVREHCEPVAVWWSSGGEVVVGEGG